MKPTLLIVGGAGYIGSHMVKRLAREACRALVLDNLSSGHKGAVTNAELIAGDSGDAALLDSLFATQRIDAVMHFASFIQVGESVIEPAKYYDNNVARTLILLDAMRRHGVRDFIFSSTAAVFGNPQTIPIDETHPMQPINPYGKSKRMVESILEDYSRAYGLRSVSLRYFNAAGADPEGALGECHDPETHLIPLVLQVASGRRPHISVFGVDYDTPDGSCVRDYIHICDLAEAHLAALQYIRAGGESGAFNLGTGKGYSVLEVIETARRITGHAIPVRLEPRREGDPATLIADGSRARDTLRWLPARSDLDTIVADAWAWERRLAAGAIF